VRTYAAPALHREEPEHGTDEDEKRTGLGHRLGRRACGIAPVKPLGSNAGDDDP
jgi:hypothetical protein